MRIEDSTYLPTQRELADTVHIRFINSTMARIIMETKAPRGRFIQREVGGFIGIDNRTGAAQKRRFATKMGCLDWLTGGSCEEIWKREQQRRESFC